MFTVVHMENDTIINKYNTRIKSVFRVLTTVNFLLPHPIEDLQRKTLKFN